MNEQNRASTRPVANKPGAKTATQETANKEPWVIDESPSREIVKVPFRGGHLLATQDNAGIWVSIKRMCEDIGLDYWTQLRKLKEATWATIVMMPTVAEDGKHRDMAMLNAKCVAKWMSELNPKKVDPALRPAIEEYQAKARDVLAAYFTPQAATAAGIDVEAIGLALVETSRQMKVMAAKVEQVPALIESKVDAEAAKLSARLNVIESDMGLRPRQQSLTLDPMTYDERERIRAAVHTNAAANAMRYANAGTETFEVELEWFRARIWSYMTKTTGVCFLKASSSNFASMLNSVSFAANDAASKRERIARAGRQLPPSYIARVKARVAA